MTKRDLHENWNEPKTVTLTYGVCHLLSGWVQDRIIKLEHRNEIYKIHDKEMKDFHKKFNLPVDSRKELRKNIQYLKAIKKALE
jgi:hypothetical protein